MTNAIDIGHANLDIWNLDDADENETETGNQMMETPKAITPLKPVAHRGRMIAASGRRHVYQPENHEWRDRLCDRDSDGKLIGKDPMDIPLDVLMASGHPQTRAGVVVLRLREMHGVDIGEMRHDGFLGLQPSDFPKRLTTIRDRVCNACCDGNKAEIRRCAIYDCPAWPFRMGRNPHNPARGKNAGIDPFKNHRTAEEE